MFDLSSKTQVNRRFRFTELYKMMAADKDIKADAKNILSVTLTNVISQETMNFTEQGKVKEVYVFEVELSDKTIPALFLSALDRAINLHTVFVLRYGDERTLYGAYKEKTEKGVKVGKYYSTGWTSDTTPIPLPLNVNRIDDNALLLEIKKQIKKLSAIVVDKVKKTVLDFANTLENLRNRYIFNRYEITQNENISTELKQYNTTIDVTVQRYNGIVQQLDNKITELKKMKAEQKHLNPIHIFRHKELTEHIDKTEKEIKKLQNLKSAFLDKMSCKSEKDIPQYKALHIKNDDIIIEIAANNTELEKQCADDKAEFISIKKSIPSEDMVAVQAERYTIHDEYTKSNIQKLQEKYGRKYSYDIYKDVEADVNMELHEKPFSILMRLEKNKQRNTDHNHTKYRNHEQER